MLTAACARGQHDGCGGTARRGTGRAMSCACFCHKPDYRFRVLRVEWASPIMGVTVTVFSDELGAFEVEIVPAGTAAIGTVPMARFPAFVQPHIVGARIEHLLSQVAEGAWPDDIEPVVTTYEDFLRADLDAMADSIRGFAVNDTGGQTQ